MAFNEWIIYAYIQKERDDWILPDFAWGINSFLAWIVYIFLENYWAVLTVQFLKFLEAQVNMTNLAKELV